MVSERTPFYYLDPRRRIVSFLHRPELDKLEEWCRPGTTRRVRLVCGPGGAGKTRLSVELVERVGAKPGWLAIRVRRADVDLDELIPALDGRKVLLCLEDGEEWAYELPRLLRTKNQSNLRILLLARTYGAWWGRLSGEQVVNSEPMKLAPLGEEFDRATILRQAYRDFRAELAPSAPADAPEVLVNAAPDATNVLALHAAALAVVLHCRDNDGRPPEGEIRLRDSLVELLAHQRNWWEAWARNTTDLPAGREWDFSGRVLLMPALYLATDHAQAKLALEQAFAGCGFAEDLPGKVAATLAKVWPPTSRGGVQPHWDPLRPDPLGETLVLQVLREADDEEAAVDLVSRIFGVGVDEAQAEHALTVLTRADGAVTDDELRHRVRRCIGTLLENHPDVFLTAGVAVAAGLTEPGPLTDLIRAASARAGEQTLRRAAVDVPAGNNALASLEAHLWHARAERLRGQSKNLTVSQRIAVAEQYRWQAYAHVRAEENAAAVDAVRQALEFYGSVGVSSGSSELAESYADALKLAADVTMRAGLHEESLRCTQHSSDLYQDLADDNGIQETLRFQGALLQEMGRHRGRPRTSSRPPSSTGWPTRDGSTSTSATCSGPPPTSSPRTRGRGRRSRARPWSCPSVTSRGRCTPR